MLNLKWCFVFSENEFWDWEEGRIDFFWSGWSYVVYEFGDLWWKTILGLKTTFTRPLCSGSWSRSTLTKIEFIKISSNRTYEKLNSIIKIDKLIGWYVYYIHCIIRCYSNGCLSSELPQPSRSLHQRRVHVSQWVLVKIFIKHVHRYKGSPPREKFIL